MTQITTDALVIAVKEFKDDRILTLLSGKYGVIKAYAKGAKRPKSKLASSTELFSYSCFVLTYNKDNYWVDKADINKIFFELRQDLSKLALASYICEVARDLALKEDENDEYLRLVLNTLHLTAKDKRDFRLIKAIYELRALTVSGFMPDLVGCCICGRFDEGSMNFIERSGTLVCNSCIGDLDAIPLNGAVVNAMRHIIYSDFKRLFSFELADSSLVKLAQICQSYLILNLGYPPKTLAFLLSEFSTTYKRQ